MFISAYRNPRLDRFYPYPMLNFMSNFPPPPNVKPPKQYSNRAVAEADPFTSRTANIPHDPRLDDDEYIGLLKKYLTPVQFKDPKLIRFVFAYLDCRNASQAARDAGLEGRGAYLRSRPEIHSLLEALTVKAVMKYGYDATEVVERVKEIANIDPIEFENPDGSYKTHMSQIAPEARRAIKKFKVKNLYGKDANGMDVVIGQLIEVELHDKQKAQEMLGTEKDIFKKTTRVEHDVTTNMAQVLLDSSRRGDERKALMGQTIDVTPKGDGDVEIQEESSDSDDAGWNGSDVPVTE